MTLSYCDISATPAFQNLVTELTPILGDRANREAFRDYLEFERIRDAKDIIAKKANDYFSIIPPVQTVVSDNEIPMTKTEMFKELGRSIPKKILSDKEIRLLEGTISRTNNELKRNGISKVYRLVDKRQQGQSDNFTWRVAAYKGNLDVEAKIVRLKEADLESNRLVRLITQGTQNLQNEIKISYGNEANFRKNLEKAQSQSNKLSWDTLFGNVDRFRPRIIQALKRYTTIHGDTESVFEGGSWGRGKRISSVKDLADMYLVHRSPLIEKLHFIYLKDGVVVGTNAYTAGLVNRTPDFDHEGFKNNYEALNADEVYILHNHPSGNHLPSPADITMTSRITAVFPNINFKGQLVIDTDKFTFIPSQSTPNFNNYEELSYTNSPKKLTKTRISLGKNKKQITNSLKEVGDLLLKNDNVNAVVYVSTYGEIVGYDGFLNEDVDSIDFVDRMRKIGAFNYAVFSPDVESSVLVNKTSTKKYSERIAFYMDGDIMKGLEGYDYDIFSPQTDLPSDNMQLWEGSLGDTVASHSQEIIRKMVEGMGQQVGVDYSFISPTEAAEVTKNSDNPWSGQKSFFYKGNTYFIAGSLKPSDVLHEFVHPIIRSISKQNRPLFESLYSKLQQTTDGQQIIEQVIQLYPTFDIESDDFKEEVLVRGIEKIQDLDSKGLQVDSAFRKFVDDLLYAIKQYLRGVFGQKIKVSELETSTTLQQLSDMLKDGGKFELDPEIITDEDIVAYKTEYDKIVEDFDAEKADKKELEKLTNDYFETVSRHLKNAIEKTDLGELSDILQNKYKTGELQKMKQNLKSFRTLILQDAKELRDDGELTRQRVQAVVNSLGNVDNMVDSIFDGLKDIVKDVDDQDNVQRVLYLQKVLNYWGDFTNHVAYVLENNGIKDIRLVDSVNANVRRANELVEDFYEKASKGVLWDTLKASAENIETKWQERIANLRAKNAPKEVIDKALVDAANEKITPDQIEKALKGQLKDLNFANAYLEGYSYSPDPVVGGLALFIKNNITKTEVRAQATFNEAATKLKPLLEKVGYNPNDPGKIGEEMGQKEKVGRVNPETQEFEEVEVWRFMNQFTGADINRDKSLYDIKKASEKYSETGSEEDKKILADLQSAWENHRRDFWNTEYTEPFYKAYDILKNDVIGNEAKMTLNNLYDDLNRLSGVMSRANSDDVLEIADQIEVKRREIKQLSSLYDISGNLKTGDELEIAQRIQQFNEALKDIYYSEEIPEAFQGAYQTYEQKLLDEGKKRGTTPFDIQMTKWLGKNSRVVIKDAFWDKMDLINESISDILSRLPQNEALNLEIEEAYLVIKEMVKGNRDEGGQPLGSELSPERQEKIKEAQEKINKARQNLTRMSGLTKQEQNTIDAIFAKMETPGGKITKEESATLSRLMSKQSSLRLNKIERMELNSLFNELEELRTKESTDSYVDTVNSFLDSMDLEIVNDIFAGGTIDKNTAFLLGDEKRVQRLFDLSSEFEEWFRRNHIEKEAVDMETNEMKMVWERTYAWNTIKPKSDKYYESTTIKNGKGEDIMIPALPSLKYYKRLVKDEYMTKKVEGGTVDNRGYWLPKTTTQGAKDDRYLNKEYERLRRLNPDKFRLLETLKELHLKNQNDLNKRAKLYLDFPRYRKQFVERIRSDKPFERILEKVRSFYNKVKDQWDTGSFNFQADQQLVKLDLFDNEENSLPIGGTSNLNIDEVSTNLIFTVMKYGLSAERNRNLAEIAPVARAIQKVINNEKNHPLESKLLANNTILQSGKKKIRYIRQRAINNLIEREFEGVQNVGWGSDNAAIQNFSNALFKTASGAFLNLNVPSAIKNSASAKFQGLIEAIAGKHMNLKDFTEAEIWATNTTFKISAEIYKKGPKSLDLQITELFDPERDRFTHSYGQSLTRTPTKDTILLWERMNDVRKWTQLQASLQIFGGIMKHQRVKQNGKDIRYLDAWELKDGKIQLKAGIDPSWGITYDNDGNQVLGDKFVQKRNEIQRVIDNLNGAMGREDRPEADRYLLFRYVSFFRRFLTSMLVNRFAYSGSLWGGTSRGRFDYQLGNTKEGWYITMLKLMGNTAKSLGRNIPYATTEEKQATLRFLSEAGTLTILKYMIIPLLFNYDSDDDDRFKKLRAKSGALPVLGVTDDPSRPFDLGGWLSNHALLNLMGIIQENRQFELFTKEGLNQVKDFTNIKSVVMGPTLNTGLNAITDLVYLTTGDDKAYYQRDIGPYFYQQEGEFKLLNHLAKAVGLSGSNVDPATTVRNFESIQNR